MTTPNGLITPPDSGTGARVPRLMSLDAFRGLVIVMMFVVNVAGSDPAFPSWFPHRGWNEGKMGVGLADFVFPWFLFIVGTSIPFSISSGRGMNLSPGKKAIAALRRGVTLYLLGTLLWCATIGYGDVKNFPKITSAVFGHWDILPLIGFGYAVGALLALLPRWTRVAFVVVIVVAKWASLTQITHPELGRVVWEQQQSFDHYVRSVFGWWGTLLTQGLPAAAEVVLGSFAGEILRSSLTRERKVAILVGVGSGTCLLAMLWHSFGGLALSKDFLTSSYILVTAGSAGAMLGILYFVVDVRGWTQLTFLRVFGLNAIAVYFVGEMVWKTILIRWQVATPDGGSSIAITALQAWLQHFFTASAGSYATIAVYVGAYWLFCRALYRRGIFIRI